MSTDHLAAIREMVSDLPPLQSSLIEHHAKALAAERDRWREYYLIAENWSYEDDVDCYSEETAGKLREARRERIGVATLLGNDTED